MGTHQVLRIDKDSRADFVKYLLSDIRALEIMLNKEMIESDIIRIGAEQEFCLVDDNWRPANNATRILNAMGDPHFTNEIARYNLEINLDPEKLEGSCFTKVESQLKKLLEKTARAAEKYDTKILLTGILPTIGMKELSMEIYDPEY